MVVKQFEQFMNMYKENTETLIKQKETHHKEKFETIREILGTKKSNS